MRLRLIISNAVTAKAQVQLSEATVAARGARRSERLSHHEISAIDPRGISFECGTQILAPPSPHDMCQSCVTYILINLLSIRLETHHDVDKQRG